MRATIMPNTPYGPYLGDCSRSFEERLILAEVRDRESQRIDEMS